MSEDKSNILSSKLNELQRQKNSVQNSMDKIQSNIRTESDMVKFLQRTKNTYQYYIDLYGSTSEETIRTMNADEFNIFMRPVNRVVTTGSGFVSFENQTNQLAFDVQSHHNECKTLGDIVAASANTVMPIAYNNHYFDRGQEVTEQYKIEDNLYEQIDYIINTVNEQFPEIHKDIVSFFEKYNAFTTDESKYQELIGARSTFFFKMIFEYSESKYNTQSRKDSIIRFIFGNSTTRSSYISEIDECLALYREMSNQGNDGDSLKKGRVSIDYIKSLFRQLITSIYSILKLRESYFIE